MAKMKVFQKKVAEKFGSSRKRPYLCTQKDDGLVVQRIEHRFPKPTIRVRFPSRLQLFTKDRQTMTHRTKEFLLEIQKKLSEAREVASRENDPEAVQQLYDCIVKVSRLVSRKG